MTSKVDIVILGAGMAGVSLAAELAAVRNGVVVDTEDQPGQHATGRSAAMYFENYHFVGPTWDAPSAGSAGLYGRIE